MIAINKTILSWVFVSFFFISCINTTKKDESVYATTSTAGLFTPSLSAATATPSPTFSPTAFPTVPTISPEDVYALLFEMLNQNTTCELSCWLNITPGASTHVDAYQKWAGFLTLLGTTKKEPRDFAYYFEYSEDDEDFFITTRYYLPPKNDTIDSMYITTQSLRNREDGSRTYAYDSFVYKNILNRYLLSSVLSTYGSPNQILIGMEIIEAEPTSPDFFHIWLFYPTIGTILEYTGSAEVKNGIIHGCPSDTFVSLWLVPPENPELFQSTLEEATGLPSSPFYKSTEDAIGKTAEEFYNEFKEPNSLCIESPLNIWPER